MAGEAAAIQLAVQTIQLLLSTFESSLAFGSYLCPLAASIDTVTSTSFDYIIVGGGSAGAVLANRLSACSDANVLLLEAGGCPPLESMCLGYFTMQPATAYDFNYTSTDDDYACQNLQGESVGMTIGKMLGGSSSLHHAIWVRGSQEEYDAWATAADDSSWNYSNLLPYFLKSETVDDAYIVNETPDYVGTSGPTILERQTSSSNTNILKSFVEMGYTSVNNSNTNFTSGIVNEPLLQKGNNLRQSSHVSYIAPVIKRSNLYVLTEATVSKINFDSSNVATGVTFTYSGTSYTVSASSEVILAAGAIITPQLLMLSGVGNSDHLTEMGIDTVADLPVGDNLQDHASATLLIALENSTATTPGADPHAFPVPVTTNYVNLANSTSQKAEFQSINLVFPQTSSGLIQLCMNVFKYKEAICQSMYEGNYGREVLWAVANILHPDSRGTVRLASTDIIDQPTVNLGLLSDSTDLENLGKFLAHMGSLVNTTYFKSIGAEVLDLGLCTDETKYSTEFWQCYALAMSSTMWHYSGTAAIGSVVDTNLLVKDVSNLRVVDASVFPTVPGGNINAAVIAVAEKAADLVLADRTSCTAA